MTRPFLALLLMVTATSLLACGPSRLAAADDDETAPGIEVSDSALTPSNRVSAWFPLNEGNRWSLTSDSGVERVVEVTSARDNMVLVSGLFAEPTWLAWSGPNGTTVYVWDGSSWGPLVRFAAPDETWATSNEPCDGLTGHRLASGVTISTPASAFENTRSFAFSPVRAGGSACPNIPFHELVFVPQVGLVSLRQGGQRFSLRSARVNGQMVPSATAEAISARLTLDQSLYVSKPNTIACITTPCPSNAETAQAQLDFEVTNNGSTAQTWTFASGCQFEVEILSASGKVLHRLGDDVACAAFVSSLTLQPGETHRYSTSIGLDDRDGLQLDGAFVMRARLIPASGAIAAQASAALTVEVKRP